MNAPAAPAPATNVHFGLRGRVCIVTGEEAKKRIMSRTPMKRLGEPWEVADGGRRR